MKLAIVADGQGSNRVHAQGCKDIAIEQKAYKNKALRTEVANRQDLAELLWSDVAKSTTEPGSAEYVALTRELSAAADTIHECAQALPQNEQDAEPAYGTVTTNTRNKHLLKRDGGENVKTACGKAVSQIVRAGEVARRNLCTICAKAQEQNVPVVLASQIDWSGDKPRAGWADAEKPEVKPTAKKAAPAPKATPKETPKPEAKAAAKKTVKAPKGSIGNAADLYAFVTVLNDRKVIKPSMKGSHECAIRRVFAAYPGEMETPVDGLTLDSMVATFGKANTHLKPVSVKGYGREVERVLEHFTAYKADTAAWEAEHPLPASK